MQHKLFVYGTLRKAFDNHRILGRAEFIGNAKTVNKYCMYADIIPFVHKNKEVSYIKGELYGISSQVLRCVDSLEGHPRWYKREEIDVKDKEKNIHRAWIYFSDCQRGRIVKSGNFLTYTKSIGI